MPSFSAKQIAWLEQHMDLSFLRSHQLWYERQGKP
jgi:hypothetical protein